MFCVSIPTQNAIDALNGQYPSIKSDIGQFDIIKSPLLQVNTIRLNKLMSDDTMVNLTLKEPPHLITKHSGMLNDI